MKRPRGKIAAPLLVLMLTTGAATWAQAQTFTVLYTFTNSPDGANPRGGLVRDGAGNLYGTTGGGGVGGGTVFKLDSAGHETILHTFTGGSDGAFPGAGLVMDGAGNLYGTTSQGGSGTCSAGVGGCGTVFRVDTAGHETVLYSFMGPPGDGARPSGLVMDVAGNLYGTTSQGGSGTCFSVAGNCGTVFKLDTAGHETVLHSFTGTGNDGWGPIAGLIMDAAGNLYGTTSAGGSGSCVGQGCGTVFKLDPSGHETVLYSFTGPPGDGAAPSSSLIMDAAGNLYGTTYGGGSGACNNSGLMVGGCGTVFKLDPSGNEKVLYSFVGGSDGELPPGGVIIDTPGNLYGTTFEGGCGIFNPNCGTVFKLDPSGHETILHTFTGGSDGVGPNAGLIMDRAGNLYGTTGTGGAGLVGIVFKLSLSAVSPRKRRAQVTSE